jgi:hypothetical protein
MSRATAQAMFVGDDRGADAALGADHREDSADRFGIRRAEQRADGAHDIDGAHRHDHVVADAAADQLAVEHHVVVAADDDDPGPGIADVRELVEAGENAGAAILRFENHHIRRRRGFVGFERGGDATHLQPQMDLRQPAVLPRGLDGRGRLRRLAECLHRHPRRRRNELLGFGYAGRLDVAGVFVVPDHFPRSLILALSRSG